MLTVEFESKFVQIPLITNHFERRAILGQWVGRQCLLTNYAYNANHLLHIALDAKAFYVLFAFLVKRRI